MNRKGLVLVWILSYEGFHLVIGDELCINGDGTIHACKYGCCGEKLNRYCCTFHIWVIVLFAIAATAVIIPALVILFCLLRDKYCHGKPMVQNNPLRRRQPAQLQAVNNQDDTLATINAAEPSTSGDNGNPAYTFPYSSSPIS
ncbi:uncharacterized protein LOC132755432 [Ruditapes philippinarum]|uniref:uncharacterized protein LOC132755432 n=1 Tax=Ruditapes philippinarum TaxID=129788 RepID=UPI00295B7494|nr:uncharacterized protein LOC132755432 [Ruditapes philippinarum]